MSDYDNDYDSYHDRAQLADVVRGLLANRVNLGVYAMGRSVNRAIQNEGAEIIVQHRRMSALVGHWETEASAPTGIYEDAQGQADDLRSEMDGEYDRGRLELAEAVKVARASRKVLLEPETCKLVVDLDHDKRMSQYLGLDVEEVFGVNPNYDPRAAVRLREMAVNSQVDFSRRVEENRSKQATTPQPGPDRGRGHDRNRDPVALKQALAEEIIKLRRSQGFEVGEHPEPARPADTFELG